MSLVLVTSHSANIGSLLASSTRDYSRIRRKAFWRWPYLQGTIRASNWCI